MSPGHRQGTDGYQNSTGAGSFGVCFEFRNNFGHCSHGEDSLTLVRGHFSALEGRVGVSKQVSVFWDVNGPLIDLL